MFTKRTTVALFAIAIASSLIVVSGGGFVGSALAKKAKQADEYGTTPQVALGKEKSSSPKSDSTNAGDSGGSTGDTNGISAKDLKSLSKCQSSAAADGDLTQAEVTDCYRQVF
jgi:hypothetical protein